VHFASDDLSPEQQVLAGARHARRSLIDAEITVFGHAKRHGADPSPADDPWLLLDVWRHDLDRKQALDPLVRLRLWLRELRYRPPLPAVVLLLLIRLLVLRPWSALRRGRRDPVQAPTLIRTVAYQRAHVLLTAAPPQSPAPTHIAGAAA
jgi:hypothetical protein